MRALTLLLLAACSETGFSIPEDPVVPVEPEGAPQVQVEPAAVDLGVVCDASPTTLTIHSTGDRPLTIERIDVGGSGWTAEPIELPQVLDAGQSLAVVVLPGDGEGSVRVTTDDPDTPVIDVPLHAVANTPPSLTLVTPRSGWTLPIGVTTPLTATVSDPDEPAHDLSVTWTSSVDGSLQSAPPDELGTAVYDWHGPDRTPGLHDLTVRAIDACGASAQSEVTVCQNEGYLADELDLSTWNFEGSARWDAGREVVALTPALTSQAGTAFQTSATIDSANVDIRFAFYMGGGTGADGLSLTVLDADRMTSFVGGLGGGIGYVGLPGYTVEVDTYYNSTRDPTPAHHISVHVDGDQGRVLAWAALPTMDDAAWHDMRVTVDGTHLTATIDGEVYIDQAFAELSGFPGYIGFTGATGALTNEHLIGTLRVERFVCDET